MSDNLIRKQHVDRMDLGQMVQLYLLASNAYYLWDYSAMTDDAFDYMCVRLLNGYDTFDHQHKRFVDKESLKAGTCMLGPNDYPTIVLASIEAFIASSERGELLTAIKLKEM